MRTANDLKLNARRAANVLASAAFLSALFLILPCGAFAQGRGGGQAPPAAKTAAPVDLTGYWVSLVTEDWRSRMTAAPKGDAGNPPAGNGNDSSSRGGGASSASMNRAANAAAEAAIAGKASANGAVPQQ